MRHLSIIESAKVQRDSRLQGRGGKQGALFEPIAVQHPEGPLATRLAAQARDSPVEQP